MATYSLVNENFKNIKVSEEMTFIIKPFRGHDIFDFIINDGMKITKERASFPDMSDLEKFSLLLGFAKDISWRPHVSAKFRNFGSQVNFNAAKQNGKIVFESLTRRRGYYLVKFWTAADFRN